MDEGIKETDAKWKFVYGDTKQKNRKVPWFTLGGTLLGGFLGYLEAKKEPDLIKMRCTN